MGIVLSVIFGPVAGSKEITVNINNTYEVIYVWQGVDPGCIRV